MTRAAAVREHETALTFAQARLLLRLIATPGASLYIESSDIVDLDRGPTFHGFFYHPACSSCGHAKREAASWRVIHALAEAACIRATWGGIYDRVTDIGLTAAEAAKAKWPMMVPLGPRDASGG